MSDKIHKIFVCILLVVFTALALCDDIGPRIPKHGYGSLTPLPEGIKDAKPVPLYQGVALGNCNIRVKYFRVGNFIQGKTMMNKDRLEDEMNAWLARQNDIYDVHIQLQDNDSLSSALITYRVKEEE